METIEIQNAIKDAKSLARLFKAAETLVLLAEHLESRMQESHTVDRVLAEKSAKLDELKASLEKFTFEAAAYRAKEEQATKDKLIQLAQDVSDFNQKCEAEKSKLAANLEDIRSKHEKEVADLEAERETARQELAALEKKRAETQAQLDHIKRQLSSVLNKVE
jgi:chromosome segregation ATPase